MIRSLREKVLTELSQRYAVNSSVYVHYPYCAALCSYCDFNKYAVSKISSEERTKLERCLAKDARRQLEDSLVSHVSSVYFGGGTPSLANPSLVERVLNAITKVATISNDAEVTLEVNPSHDVTAASLGDFNKAGINRISIGVQSLNDEELKFLGRTHTSSMALSCLSSARSVFPGRVSVDLLFGRPEQTLSALEEELSRIQPLLDGHLSVYQLTLERGTPLFKAVQKGDVVMPNEETTAEMFAVLATRLQETGFRHYEISNFAATSEAMSRHNLNYWNGGQYLGVGPGAHGRVIDVASMRKERTLATPFPARWIKRVEECGHGVQMRTPMTLLDCWSELAMTSLRTDVGLLASSWNKLSLTHPQEGTDSRKPPNLIDAFGSPGPRLSRWFEDGSLALTTDALYALPHSRAVLDSILPDVLNHLKELASKFR